MCGPMWCDSEALCVCVCVCVCFLRCFPLTQHKSTVSFLNTYCYCTLTIHYRLFSQFIHSSSLLNIHFLQMEMVLRKMAQVLDLLCLKAKPRGDPSVASLNP